MAYRWLRVLFFALNNMKYMKLKSVLFLPLFLAACVVSGKGDDLLDAASARSVLREPGNGTITDAATGLTWKKCSQGQSDDALCSGAPSTFQYCNADDNTCNGVTGGILTGSGTSAAYTTCNALNTTPAGGYAGKTTWRVPTYDELRTININALPSDGIAFTVFFPNTDKAANYLSASSNATFATTYLVTNFNGSIAGPTKTTPNRVRCVAQ